MKRTERNGRLVGVRGAQVGAELGACLQAGVVAGRRLLWAEVGRIALRLAEDGSLAC